MQQKMSWKEYDLSNKSIADWLPWLGLSHENVLRNKDDSVLGMIRYKRFREDGTKVQRIALPSFRQGWSIWFEEQYDIEKENPFDADCILTVAWNPFLTKTGDMVKNTLDGESIPLDAMESVLAKLLQRIARSFPEEAAAKVLVYQEIIDNLTFALTLGRERIEMPDPPLDLDSYLTQDLDLDFSANHVRLGNEVFLVLTLPGITGTRDPVYERIGRGVLHAGIPYRHVQRLLLFDEKTARKELASYTAKWCPSRKYIKDMLTDGILQKLNGYYNNQMIFLIPAIDYERMSEYLRTILYEMELPFIIEDYNAKDLWWGSLPGLFRAGLVPPLCGFSSLEELLAMEKSEEAEEEEANREETDDV